MRSEAAAVLVALLAAAPAALAQCTIPAIEPPLTEGDCGAELEAGATCTVACAAGQAEGAEGSYDYTCNEAGDDFDAVPAPACTPCPANEYSEAPGSATCTPCPDNSVTLGEGSTAPGDCLCNPGYSGTIPEDPCTACVEGTYKEAPAAAGECEDCPTQSTTLAEAATLITECLCNPGWSGTIVEPDDPCTACVVGTYKEAPAAAGDCEDCPTQSITLAEAATLITECLCNPGYRGTIEEPTSLCTACETGTYKEAPPAAAEECEACPERSSTDANAADAITLCRCEPGFFREEDITAPDDECDPCAVDFAKAQPGNVPCTACAEGQSTGGNQAALTCTPQSGGLTTGAVVGITAAAIVGVGAAFGGVMYGKSNYNRYRRESVNQNAPGEPLMAGGQS